MYNRMVDPDMQALMVDIGHNMMKCGFSGDDAPRAVFPTICGRPKNPGIMVGMAAKDCFVGDEAQAKRGILKNKIPIPNNRYGKYDFEDIEKIFHHTFYNELCLTPEEHPLLITSLQRMDRSSLRILTELFFETFDCPAFHVCDPHLLGLYASGRTTGVVLDCGSSICSSISILEGQSIQHSKVVLEDREDKTRKRISGDLITDLFSRLLNENKKLEVFTKSMAMAREVAVALKENYMSFTISEDLKTVPGKYYDVGDVLKEPTLREQQHSYYDRDYYQREYERNMIDYRNKIQRNDERGTKIEYQLRDGNKVKTMVDIGDERFDAPEILFRPRLVGYNLPGIQHLVKHSVEKMCEPDLHERMYNNIVLIGGTTCIKNFPQKLYWELKKIVRKEYESMIEIHASLERKYATWIGGSILSSLSTFLTDWVTKEEYDDHGYGIVEAKCQGCSMEGEFQQENVLSSMHFLTGSNVDPDMEERRMYILEEEELEAHTLAAAVIYPSPTIPIVGLIRPGSPFVQY